MEDQSKSENTRALRITGWVVSGWLAVVALAPPSGLLWQFGTPSAVGGWFVTHILAALHLTGLIT